jgi:Fe-S cluster assembly ATP-binding protein
MNKTLLEIKNLNASIGNKRIIKGFNLSVNKGETHIIMGPNGSGKSTLSKILAGHPSYQIHDGSVNFNGKDLLILAPEIRALEGLFLAFQSPPEVPGVTNYDFLRISFNEKRKYLRKSELNPLEFMKHLNVLLNKLKMKYEFLNRNLNEGFSGGEKKRNEILQLLVLKPKLIILDEIDSGVDLDALKIICNAITNNLSKNVALIVITHYPRLLDYLKPSYVHIMKDGHIEKTGDIELVKKLEKDGYDHLT